MKYTQTIPANGVLDFKAAGKLFLIDSISAGLVMLDVLRGNGSVFNAPNVGFGFRLYANDAPFDGVRITGAPGESISFFIANEDVQISTVSGASVSVPGGVVVNNTALNPVPVAGTFSATVAYGNLINSLAPVSIGTTAALVAAAVPGTQSLRIFNNGATDIYLGPAGVTAANGAVKVGPGQIWLENEAPSLAWYAISAAGTNDVRIQRVTF